MINDQEIEVLEQDLLRWAKRHPEYFPPEEE
jgi:hypothetical protein